MDNITIQKKLDKHIYKLNILLKQVQEIYPNANYYLANDSLHILSDSSHDDNDKPRQDRSIAMATLIGSGGGDW